MSQTSSEQIEQKLPYFEPQILGVTHVHPC